MRIIIINIISIGLITEYILMFMTRQERNHESMSMFGMLAVAGLRLGLNSRWMADLGALVG